MGELETVYSSNIPVNCHIIKGRLETEGISCFIFDEHLISVNPFKAIALGGVKLKVPADKIAHAQKILELTEKNILFDENGEYLISEIINTEIAKQNEILTLKHKIRCNKTLLEKEINFSVEYLNHKELEEVFEQEKEFLNLSEKEFIFSWSQFFYELFDFEKSVFKYLRTRPVDYYLEKEIVDNYTEQEKKNEICHCPECNSDNVGYGYAIDYKWDFAYILISILLFVPLFPIRKKYHCFDCGLSFNRYRLSSNQKIE